MTIFLEFCSQTILQKSFLVPGKGPWAAMYSVFLLLKPCRPVSGHQINHQLNHVIDWQVYSWRWRIHFLVCHQSVSTLLLNGHLKEKWVRWWRPQGRCKFVTWKDVCVAILASCKWWLGRRMALFSSNCSELLENWWDHQNTDVVMVN